MYRILVVDDEKFIRKSICNRMKWQQFDMEVAGEAANGQEALELIGQLRPHVVLVDIRMPVMDGIGFIGEAKRRYPQVYYIIMSAYNDFAYAKRAIQLGVEDYILKPVKTSELEQILGRIVHELNQKRLSSHLLEPEEGNGGLGLLFRESRLWFWLSMWTVRRRPAAAWRTPCRRLWGIWRNRWFCIIWRISPWGTAAFS